MSEAGFLARCTTKKSCFHKKKPSFFGLVENGARFQLIIHYHPNLTILAVSQGGTIRALVGAAIEIQPNSDCGILQAFNRGVRMSQW